MDKLMMFDGNFEGELRNHLTATEQLREDFAIKALESNRYAVYKTHLTYLRAGAQIIRTNTYRVQINVIKSRCDLPPIVHWPLINVAVKLAKQAIITYYEKTTNERTYEDYDKYYEHRPLIAGSCGSCSASWNLNIASTIDIDIMTLIDLYHFHIQRVKKLLEAGVDLLTFESIPSQKEAIAIIRVLKECPTVRVWISFLCSPKGKLLDGTKFVKIATTFYDCLPYQVIAIGAEGVSRDRMKLLMQNVNKNRDIKIPFVLYAEKTHLPTTYDSSASSNMLQQYNFVKEWINEGVRYFGGGVNTFADDMKKIRKQIDNYYVSTNVVFTKLKGRVCSYRDKENQSKL